MRKAGGSGPASAKGRPRRSNCLRPVAVEVGTGRMSHQIHFKVITKRIHLPFTIALVHPRLGAARATVSTRRETHQVKAEVPGDRLVRPCRTNGRCLGLKMQSQRYCRHHPLLTGSATGIWETYALLRPNTQHRYNPVSVGLRRHCP